MDVLVKKIQELIQALGPVVDLMESSTKGKVTKLEGLTNCRVIKKENKNVEDRHSVMFVLHLEKKFKQRTTKSDTCMQSNAIKK